MVMKLEGILKPQARPVGLLIGTAADLQIEGNRWQAGIEFTTYGADGLSRNELVFCADDSDGDDYDPPSGAVSGTLARFGAFDVFATEECSSLDVDMAWLEGRLDDRWMAMLSEPIAAELEHGATATQLSDGEGGGPQPSPTLANSATVASAGPDSLAGAFAAIERGLATLLHGAVGFVHVPPEVLSLAGGDLIEMDVATNCWRTYTGHVIIADAGYTGAAPDAGAETTGTRWIYGSGPVGYQIGPPRTNAVALEGFDSARNVFTARKIAQALVAFDPATVVAAEVELPDSLAS